MGPNINSDMSPEAPPLVQEALDQARAHAAVATPVRRALIEALSLRHPAGARDRRSGLRAAHVGALSGAAISGWQARRFAFITERGPHTTEGRRLVLALVGGFIAAYGAKLAKGCTSGQALTGASALNVSGLVFMGATFLAAFAVAQLVRKEWL
jgi:hypothetical protein